MGGDGNCRAQLHVAIFFSDEHAEGSRCKDKPWNNQVHQQFPLSVTVLQRADSGAESAAMANGVL